MKKYISEIITRDDIKQWEINDTILINSPTGSGKSYFIRKILLNHCIFTGKKILLITNRKILKEQVQNQIELDKSEDIITVMNYQQIEERILHSDGIEHYDYIVADECHYFFSDALFSRKTDVSFNWLIGLENCTKILLSATSKLIEMYFKNNNIKLNQYTIEDDYDYIEKFYFYSEDDVLKKMLSEIPEMDKVIYFTGVKKAYDTSLEFENAKFICSDRNKTYIEYSDAETKKSIIENEMFDCKILCCTSVLDNGINILDNNLKHIIVDIFDLDILQQCIGRKRIEDVGDKINIYIKDRKGRSLNTRINMNNKKLEQAEYLKEHGKDKFLTKYVKETICEMIDVVNINNITELVINEMMYEKVNQENELCKILQNDADKLGYQKAVIERFNVDLGDVIILEDEYDALTLEYQLDKLVGIKMFKEEQISFKEFINKNVIQVIKGSHDSIGYKTINARFEELELDYFIESKEEKSNKEGKVGKRYWMVGKKIYELV